MHSSAQVAFYHDQAGSLSIDNGLDQANWGYNLNTQSFPTYGGEVVQILSVYVNDITIGGTITTYEQMEAIYSYFARYLQVATQGRTATPNIGDNTKGVAYNLYPMFFSYPARHWYFKIYPTSVPGFRYALDVTAPVWQLTAHVIDDSPDLDLIKEGIKALEVQKLVDGSSIALKGQISPNSGNPDTDPFQTEVSSSSQQQQVINKYADYYNSLIPAYMKGDFSALTAGIGSTPNFGHTKPSQAQGNNVTVPPPSRHSDKTTFSFSLPQGQPNPSPGFTG